MYLFKHECCMAIEHLKERIKALKLIAGNVIYNSSVNCNNKIRSSTATTTTSESNN